MHPTLTHVPPRSLRSTIAVLRPDCASRTASDGPACPAPITIASSFTRARLLVLRAGQSDDLTIALDLAPRERGEVCRTEQVHVYARCGKRRNHFRIFHRTAQRCMK